MSGVRTVSNTCLWLTEFESSEGKHAALSSSKDLLKENYLICPSLTPPHLPSWAAMTTPITMEDPDMEAAEDEERTHMHNRSQVGLQLVVTHS